MPYTEAELQQFRAWGTIGAHKRAAKLSKRRRRQIAKIAAKARWAKKNGAN